MRKVLSFFILLNVFIIKTNATTYLYDELKSKAVADDISSTYVTSENGIDFAHIASDENGKGLYIDRNTKTASKPIVYFRGNIDNNHVIYNGFCWQIVRTTSKGGIKIVYDGTPTDGKCQNVKEAKLNFQSSINDDAALNLHYAIKENDQIIDSTIKSNIDNWYKNNLIDYTAQIEDTDYCNDYSGFDNTDHSYALARINAGNPTLNCPREEDKFTVKKSNGNGMLKYPIGTITADELAYGGMIYSETDTTNFYSIATSWLSITPYSSGKILYPNSKGKVNQNTRNSSKGVRVVIALNNKAFIESGNGSSDSPYIIKFPAAYKIKQSEDEVVREDESAMQDSEVSFKINERAGYKLTNIKFYDNNNKEIKINYTKKDDTYFFEMPAKDVTITPIFELITYKLTTDNESIIIDKEKNVPNEEASFKLEYDEKEKTFTGIKFYDNDNAEVNINYTENNNVYTFTMPEKDIIVKPSFEKIKYKLTTEDNNIEIENEENDAKSKAKFKINYDKENYKITKIEFFDEEENELDIEYKTTDNETFEIVMPTKNIKVKATIGIITYKLTSTNSEIIINQSEYPYDEEASFTIESDEKDKIKEIVFYNKKNKKINISYTEENGTYKFNMPKEDIRIEIIYKGINPKTIDNIYLYIGLMIISIISLFKLSKWSKN